MTDPTNDGKNSERAEAAAKAATAAHGVNLGGFGALSEGAVDAAENAVPQGIPAVNVERTDKK